MLDLFRQATESALALLGEGAFLRGNVPCQVNIEHGVQLTGFDDEMVVDKDIATISTSVNPKVGDTLDHPDGKFVLDALLEDKGAFRRFVIRKV